jgi:hypothetical protein
MRKLTLNLVALAVIGAGGTYLQGQVREVALEKKCYLLVCDDLPGGDPGEEICIKKEITCPVE